MSKRAPKKAAPQRDVAGSFRGIAIADPAVKPRGRLLPGRTKFVSAFQAFRGALPDIARAIRHRADEIGGITNYRTFICCVAEFLRRAGR